MNRLLPVLALLLAAPAASAHDYWLRPESFRLQPGETTAIHLYVGDELKIETERPFQKQRTPRLSLLGPAGSLDLLPELRNGQNPLLTRQFSKPGTWVLALDRNAQGITLAGRQFDAYLKEEGLEDIRALRRRQGKGNTPGRERYARSIKALIQVGNEPVSQLPVTGQRLEIVPEANPYRLRPGDQLPVQVRFEGQPLAGHSLVALGPDGSHQRIRTDASGRAQFRLDRPGAWLVRLVYMRPCQTQCARTDWESFWSSLSFELPAGS